jgi:methyl-accepting chemotaxis protein
MDIIELEKSLSELHKELARLTPAIKLAEKAVETTDLAKAIPERHQQLIKELKAVFVNPDESEKKEFVNVYTSIKILLSELDNVKESIKEYVKQITDLVEYLKNNDIPKKLEAINFQLTSINNSLLAVQGQLNGIQSSLNSISNTVDNIRQNTDKILADVKSSKESLEEKIKAFENSTTQKFQEIAKRQDKQDKELITLKTILFIICGLIVIGAIATIVVLK